MTPNLIMVHIPWMAKKKKKNRSKKRHETGNHSPGSAEAHMAAGRFRQAVDAFKALCKNDQATYEPQLKAAYEGLYHQRLEKSQFAEAAMVLDQLEKRFPGTTQSAAIALHIHRQDYEQAAGAAAALLNTPEILSDMQTHTAADALVIAFQSSDGARPLPQALHQDLQRIRAALESIAEGGYDAALESVRAIGMRSIFAAWKWLIKGMCAFYGGQDEKAVAAFGKIAPETTPARAAAPYLKLLQSTALDDADAKDSRLMEQMGIVAGYGADADVLARAEYLWRVNRHRDSHAHLRKYLDDFPTLDRGLARTLTELYYNACFEMPPSAGDKYIAYLKRSASGNGRRNDVEHLWTQRTLALFCMKTDAYDWDIVDQWEHFLKLNDRLVNGDARGARSLVFSRLGDLFAVEADAFDPFLFFKRHTKGPTLRNSKLARQCYEQSVAADPENLKPQLSLAAFLEKIRDESGLNKLLDRLIRQFPDNKDALAKAGIRCTRRNAFIKAMKYLERALALDPTDRKLREEFIIAAITAARRYVKKNNADKARKLLPQVLEKADLQSDDFNLGRAYLYARWAAIERLLKDDGRAETLWEKTIAEHQGSELKLHLFFWVVAGAYGVNGRRLAESKAKFKKALKGRFNAQTAVDCIQTVMYTSRLADDGGTRSAAMDLIERYLAGGVKKEMTRAQAEIIVSALMSDEFDRPDIAKKYVDEWLKRNRDDANFRYMRLLIETQSSPLRMISDSTRKELETILQLAREQREPKVVAEAQKMLRALERMPSPEELLDNPFIDLDEDFDDDFEDDDQEEYWDERRLPVEPQPEMPAARKTDKNEKPKSKGYEQLDLF